MLSSNSGQDYTRMFLMIAIVISAFAFVYTLSIFIDAFLGAVILYLLFRHFMRWLVLKKKWNKYLSAILILFVTFILIMTPVLAASFMIIPKLTLFFKEGTVITNVINEAGRSFEALTGYQLLGPEDLVRLREKSAEYITNFVGRTLIIITDIALMYFILFYMLINVGKTEAFVERNLPFTPKRVKSFSKELITQTYSNTLGAPLLGLIQSIFAAGGYYLFGLPDPIFWGVMTGLFSFFPVVGSTLIWLPAGIFQLSYGSPWEGWAIILYGVTVISSVDNIFRFIFQKKFANVHPLITVIGVIVGLQLFGVTGIIFGPLLISYFIILLKIFKEEYIVYK